LAKLSKWAIFFRAFLVVFLSGNVARSVTTGEGEPEAWAEALRACDPDAFFTYLSRFPAGPHVEQALMALSELGALQVTEELRYNNICLDPIRLDPTVPIPAQAKVDPPEPLDDLY
jgi:hypothetical protein